MKLSLNLIFLIPDFVKTAKELLGIKDLPINIGIGTFFGGVAAGVGATTGLVGQIGSFMMDAQHIPGLKNILGGKDQGEVNEISRKLNSLLKNAKN